MHACIYTYSTSSLTVGHWNIISILLSAIYEILRIPDTVITAIILGSHNTVVFFLSEFFRILKIFNTDLMALILSFDNVFVFTFGILRGLENSSSLITIK